MDAFVPSKKRVLIIGFGGTIAMIPENGVLRPAKSIDEILAIVPSLGDMADVEVRQVINLDSTNLSPKHWNQLIDVIVEVYEKYDAIIVTHGTDTMAYTATAISFAFGRGLKKPIIFTGSQLPLVEYGTDARFNLENSMKVAIEAVDKSVAEVMIVFDDVVLRANRTIKVSESKFRAFDSPGFPPIGSITAVGVTFGPEVLKRDDTIPLVLNRNFSEGVLAVELYPGLQPELISPALESGRCAALLLKSLGAGNVPSEEPYSLIPLIRHASKELKIPVLVSTKFVGGNTLMEIYEPGKLALEAGAISTDDLTDVAAQVKCMWALSTWKESNERFNEIIKKNYIGEKK
jgi:L-asparaginase